MHWGKNKMTNILQATWNVNKTVLSNWQYIIICSGYGLVMNSAKPLLQPMITNIHDTRWHCLGQMIKPMKQRYYIFQVYSRPTRKKSSIKPPIYMEKIYFHKFHTYNSIWTPETCQSIYTYIYINIIYEWLYAYIHIFEHACMFAILRVVSSIPTWSMTISQFLCGLYVFSCSRASKLNQQICMYILWVLITHLYVYF